MVTAIASNRILCGVEVDSMGEPLKAWCYSPADGDKYDDYQQGAYRAYHGLSRLTQKHSAEYKKGRSAQLRLLPKRSGSRSGRAIAWHRCLYRKGQNGWHMGENW